MSKRSDLKRQMKIKSKMKMMKIAAATLFAYLAVSLPVFGQTVQLPNEMFPVPNDR